MGLVDGDLLSPDATVVVECSANSLGIDSGKGDREELHDQVMDIILVFKRLFRDGDGCVVKSISSWNGSSLTGRKFHPCYALNLRCQKQAGIHFSLTRVFE